MVGSSTTSDSPGLPAVVYDGECPFCLKQIARIKRRDCNGAFEYVSRQTDGIELRFPKLAEGDFDSGMRLVHSDQSISVGADAVYEIARRLHGWRRLAWLYRVPIIQGVLRGVYGWIAKNRYRLAKTCERGTCELPDP